MQKLALLALPALALGACSKDKAKKAGPGSNLGSQPAETIDPTEPKARVVATISVDWEGAFLSEDGLEELSKFRKEWGTMPLTHFVCPTYFIHSKSPSDTTAQIKKHIFEQDEVGLHVHAWFSLAEAASVTPRSSPNFYGDDRPLDSLPNGDRGYEVALSAYSPQELSQLIAASGKLLEDNGLGKPTSFRSGGYVAPPALLSAVRAAGMHVDSSAAWSVWFDEGQGNFQKEIDRHWPNMQELTQPYGVDTPAGPIVEVPNTGSFAEFATADEMLGHLQRAASQSRTTGKPMYVNFGVHQESADEYMPLVSDALRSFEDDYPGVIHFSTITEVADATIDK